MLAAANHQPAMPRRTTRMTTVSSGLPPIPTYLSVSANEVADIAAYGKATPAAQTAVDYLQSVAATLTTPAKLLSNYRALQVVLGAFDMTSAINQTALLHQLMTQNPNTTSSLAYKLGNVNYTRFATAMTQTPFPLTTASGVSAIVNQYLANRYEANEGTLVPGMQQALYFTNNIGDITSYNELISDQTLLGVVVGGANLPSNFQSLDYSQQTQILSQSVPLSDFQNAAWVKNTAETYLIQTQEAQSTNSSDPTGVLTLLGATSSATPSTDILGALYPGLGSSSGSDLLSTIYPSSSGGTTGAGVTILSLFA
jgi:hypothetical protein